MTQQGQGDVEITAAELRRLLDYDQETGVFTWKVQRTGSVKIGSPAGRRNKRGYILIGLSHRRWQARISVNGTRLNLGSFDNIEDAAKAYQRAAIENFGPFVRSEQ